MTKPDLEWYERQWQEAQRQAQQARHERNAAEEMVLALRHENQELMGKLEEQTRRANTLEADLSRLTANLQKALEGNAVLKQSLDGLMARMGNERFWRSDFAQPLASELAEFEEAAVLVNNPADWKTVFELWQQETLEGLGRMLEGETDEAIAQSIRRRVLAQWIYLRWLQITNLFREQA